MDEPSDAELISASCAGSTEAFTRLVRRYENRLFRSMAQALASRDDAQDICQDAFVRVWEKLPTFRQESSFYSWLFRIAFNIAVTQRRRSRVRPSSLDDANERTGFEVSEMSDPARGLQVTERQRAVQQALAELSEEYRLVLVLKEMDELSYDEIAGVLGCPLGTIRSRIHRARAELKTRLERTLPVEDRSYV